MKSVNLITTTVTDKPHKHDANMETRVLMPPELSLVVTKRPLPPLDRLVPLEECIKVCSSCKKISAGTKYSPFSGTVRADKLPLLPYLAPFDVRSRFGGYDSSDESGRRTCNWVRFLKVSHVYSEEVNIVGYRYGPNCDVVFEVIRDINNGSELVAYLIPEAATPEEVLLVPALQLLRTSFYRKAIDEMIADAPLDLSRSLLKAPQWENSRRMVDNASPSPCDKRTRMDGSDSEDVHSEGTPPSSPVSLASSLSPPPSAPSSTVFARFHNIPFTPAPNGGFLGAQDLRFPPGLLSSRIPRLPSNLPTPPSSTSPQSSLRCSPTNRSLSHATAKRRERTMLPCSECGKAFDRPSLLKRHMRTHTGEKPHVCDVCSRAFSTSSSLNTHRRIHSGEKPHQCPVCGKRFTASSNLYYHKMTHVKEKPHKCTLCTRSFPTPGDLRSHMFVHNGQWPHKCTVCGKGFSKITNLRNHSLLHAGKSRMLNSEEHATGPL